MGRALGGDPSVAAACLNVCSPPALLNLSSLFLLRRLFLPLFALRLTSHLPAPISPSSCQACLPARQLMCEPPPHTGADMRPANACSCVRL
jgi:hypothetical protein